MTAGLERVGWDGEKEGKAREGQGSLKGIGSHRVLRPYRNRQEGWDKLGAGQSPGGGQMGLTT